MSERELYRVYDRWRTQILTDHPDTAVQYSERLAERAFDSTLVSGRVLREDGSPVEGAWVWPYPSPGLSPVGLETDTEGRFKVELSPNATKLAIYVTVGDQLDCGMWYSGGSVTARWSGLSPFEPEREGGSELSIELPDDFCRHRFRGRVVGEDGRPLAGLPVSLGLDDQGQGMAYTGSEGEFDILVPTAGSYSVFVQLWPRSATPWPPRCGHRTERMSVGEGPARDLRVVIPNGQCDVEIRGVLRRWNGEPVSHARVSGADFGWETRTDADGRFQHVMSDAGATSISAQLESRWFERPRAACLVDPRAVNSQGSEIEITPDGIRDLDLRLPERACELRLSGRLIRNGDLDDVVAYLYNGRGGRVRDEVGLGDSFEFAVAPGHTYWLMVHSQGCSLHIGEAGRAGRYADRVEIAVGELDRKIDIHLSEEDFSRCFRE